MKYQKLVSEINILLDSAVKKHQKQQTKLNQHIKVFKAEEQKLRKRLNKETSTASRKKLKRELGDMKKYTPCWVRNFQSSTKLIVSIQRLLRP